MNVVAPARRFDPHVPEMIDLPGLDPALLREELQMLEAMNRRLQGHQLVLDYVQRFLGSPRMKALSILDLGTGAADIPRAIAGWARKHELAVTITAVDCNPKILEIARESCRDWPEIRLEQHDMRALPYAPHSFDLVICSLALHHFDAADSVVILRQINKISRVGYLVNDLRRNWLAIGAMELLGLTVFRNRVFRHDARQSCRAAFTVGELRRLAKQASLDNFQIRRHHGIFRMVLAGHHEPPAN